MKKAPSPTTAKEPSDSFNFNIFDSLRARFLAGNRVLINDYPESKHAEVNSAIKLFYYIPRALLREGGAS